MTSSNSKIEAALNLPLRAFEKVSKKLLFELAGGERFYLVGGRSRRPLPKGAAGFTPREMRVMLDLADEEALIAIIKMKKLGMADLVVGLEEEKDENPPAADFRV